jgi:DNA-directed RNA polymerase specialized sigma24 family protein
MDEPDWLAERFEEHRTRLRAVAYRMLGSLSEADDAVQETWLRLSRTDTDEVENLGGWLTTVVARVSLSMLRSRRLRREEPLDVPSGAGGSSRSTSSPTPSASSESTCQSSTMGRRGRCSYSGRWHTTSTLLPSGSRT